MAKKKSDSAEMSKEAGSGKKKSAKAGDKNKKTTGKPAIGGTSLINTDEAAAAAARMLAGRAKLQGQLAESTGSKETGSFKQLKESLNRPAAQAAVSTALGSTFGEHKSNLPQQGNSQVVHNQASGVVGRFNVPRRTNG